MKKRKIQNLTIVLIIIMIISLVFLSIKTYNNEISKRETIKSNYYVRELLESDKYTNYIINDFKDITLYFPNLTHVESIILMTYCGSKEK